MRDSTEHIRRQRLSEINSTPNDRAVLEEKHGQVWDTKELARDYIVTGFLAPLIVVKRKSDGVVGSLEFQHNPRFYFDFQADESSRLGQQTPRPQAGAFRFQRRVTLYLAGHHV